ncbi:MAG: hypothetical protein QW590_01075 [Candidatus Bilamarchaeaceae archaeon]
MIVKNYVWSFYWIELCCLGAQKLMFLMSILLAEVALNIERANDLLLSYFLTIVVKDIKERYNVREGQKLEMFARILAENPSTLLSIRRIGRNIGISAATAERFAS